MRTLKCALILATLAAMGPARVAEEACSILRGKADQSIQSYDIATAKTLFAPVQANCDAAYSDWFGRNIASEIYNLETKNGTPNEVVLVAALAYGRPWQLLATLGDIASDDKARPDRWKAAALRYQEALIEIADVSHTTTPPPAEIIRSLRKRAEEAQLLASGYVRTARSRDGSNAGLAARSIRGVAIVTVASPVWFEYNKTSFTEEGRKAAEDMAEFLRNEKPQPAAITIIGHADPRGSDDYNLDLSKRRAQTLAEFLRASGVAIPISTVGKGKSEPYQPEYAQGIRWNDPAVGIVWPIADPIISLRDDHFPDFVA